MASNQPLAYAGTGACAPSGPGSPATPLPSTLVTGAASTCQQVAPAAVLNERNAGGTPDSKQSVAPGGGDGASIVPVARMRRSQSFHCSIRGSPFEAAVMNVVAAPGAGASGPESTLSNVWTFRVQRQIKVTPQPTPLRLASSTDVAPCAEAYRDEAGASRWAEPEPVAPRPSSGDKAYGVGEGSTGWLEIEPGNVVWVERLHRNTRRPPVLRPRAETAPGRHTLVLDLDETLVHSHGSDDGRPYDLAFEMRKLFTPRGGNDVFVRKRPYVDQFLAEVSQLFEVMVFTASGPSYAEPVLNFLDPTRTIFTHRLFNACTVYVNGHYLKDLDILGRDLSKTVIVDNSPQWFGYQLDNGIPIRSWVGDEDDCALADLLPFLRALLVLDDVRPAIRTRHPFYPRPPYIDAPSPQEDNPLYRKDPPPPHGV